MDVIIEVQCFRDSNDTYVIKEVAIVGINEAFVGHWILAPEYSFVELNEKSRRINNWLSLNYHGIEWYDGETNPKYFYPRLREITSHVRNFMTNGKEKASYLQNLLARNVYNLENISPTSNDLSPSERIKGCSFHTFRKHRRYHCALRDVYKLKHWFIEQSQINIRKRDNIYVTRCLSSKIDEEDRENSYSDKSGSEQSPVKEEENETNTELEHSVEPSVTITIALPERIITGDEKWIVYNNINRKRSWSKHEPAQTVSKVELHQKKIMLSIWWDYKSVMYFEMLPSNQTINSDVDCQQLMKLEEAIKEKRPELANRKGIVFHHDNARPHTSLATRTKLLELGWEVRFTAKEEKTGGIGKCSPRNVSLDIKPGSLPFVRPDGSKIAAKLMKRRRRCYSLEMQSNKNQYMIKIEAPPAGDWYIIAFRSWTDPDSGKIKQQGLGVSCETVLDAEMFVELPSTTLLVDPRLEHKLQLNDTSDSAVIQFYVPDVYLMESSLVLSSSCSEDCNITVHVTAGDNLVNILLNSTQTSLFFKPYANSFHYITLRLLSGNMSNIIVRLINQVIFDQVTPVELTRKSFPEFFLFDYEHLYGNDTKPQPFNVTADILSVFNFKIGRVYDVGGTITLGFKLVDINEKYKNIVLIACISLGHYSNITSGGACERVHGITTADVYVNITGPAYIHVPFPEEGTWYVSMRAFCSEETTDSNICPCGQMCLRGDTACNTCDCLSRCPVQVESIVASSPCIEGRCNDHGKCMHYMSGGFVFSACHCTGGYRGFDCADDAYVLTHSAGAIVLAMGAEMDRTALWVFLLPAVTGSAMIGLFWGYRCRRKQTIRYPSRPYRTIYFPAGLLLVSLGLVSYAFLQTRKNYYLVHSLWHICVAIGVILLLPKRQYMK
ncbi:uncharacterized protein LOC105180994 [Harpegnathos saltator]|uniref:uncharacterized protein LOC105180994 n=1 Tax=Harpegnathos saltator TaxID=610380 RepID=UPI000DBEE3C2|nr:uncharacterized protein LOC105180994 [Harpegnathos saltator]